MARPLVLAALLLVLPTGCLETLDQKVACEDPAFAVLTGPLGTSGLTRPRSQPIPSLVWVTNRATLPLDLVLPDAPRVEAAPDGPEDFSVTFLHGNQSIAPNGTSFARVDFTGTFAGESPLFVIRATLQDPPGATATCRNQPTSYQMHRFGGEPKGEEARPGHGALVHTAGFWPNGTLFYTNMERVDNDATLARAGWYEFESKDPLKVYVYNSTRDELPPRYNRSGYGTTIPGFNEALKDFVTSGSRIADVAPEQAYTRPGNEKHRLYGDRLIFYIEIDDVVAINCPQPQPVCEIPTPPPFG